MRILSMPKVTIVPAMLDAACSSPNALTIPINAMVADSIQQFSTDALDSFSTFKVTVAPLGNATAGATEGAFVLPVTSISINLSGLKIAGGAATGSALEFSRVRLGTKVGLTLANFNINYLTQQVLADTTVIGSGTTKAQTPIYNFQRVTPLSLKYQFPLNISMTETLGSLYLTPEAVDAFAAGLMLPNYARAVIEAIDFGTLFQDIKVKFRSKPVSSKPYVPAL